MFLFKKTVVIPKKAFRQLTDYSEARLPDGQGSLRHCPCHPELRSVDFCGWVVRDLPGAMGFSLGISPCHRTNLRAEGRNDNGGFVEMTAYDYQLFKELLTASLARLSLFRLQSSCLLSVVLSLLLL